MRTLASWARGGGRPGSRLTVPSDLSALARGWGITKRRVPLGAPARPDTETVQVTLAAPKARLPRFDVDVVGLEALTGVTAPVVVVANHPGFVDQAVLAQVLPSQWHVQTKGLELALRSGHSVLLFPEGGPSPDGTVGAFNPRAAALALRHGVPLVPIAIRGSFGLDSPLPRTSGGALPRVLVRFGDAIDPTGDPDLLIEFTRDSVVSLLAEDASTWFSSLAGTRAVTPVTGWRAAWQSQDPALRPGSRTRPRIWGE
ncbi:MAG TPA: lysophospholipid acyltransferase family protein [Propionibacteriaceae bacterium]|nr:lysophospholipid acyltransferase family protein [Propionibacteriaceae bacterium]